MTSSLHRPSLDALPGWVAAFSTRLGGVSAPPFGSLNLSRSVGDKPDAVAANRALVCTALGVRADQLAVAGQVHGAEVCVVEAPGLYPGFDGLVTAVPDVVLTLTAADCASVLLADPVRRVAGACHAGWRGTVAGIVGRTVSQMQDLGADPSGMQAYVSPCISAAHFEVGEEVAAAFAPAYVVRPAGRPRPYVDLKAALRDQLVEAGVRASHVTVDPRCTYADRTLFFSHRADQGQTGRMMGFVGMVAVT
ncbi:MAG: peptidoglycan editing factor PgeF [Bacteroidota bacterium]